MINRYGLIKKIAVLVSKTKRMALFESCLLLGLLSLFNGAYCCDVFAMQGETDGTKQNDNSGADKSKVNKVILHIYLKGEIDKTSTFTASLFSSDIIALHASFKLTDGDVQKGGDGMLSVTEPLESDLTTDQISRMHFQLVRTATKSANDTWFSFSIKVLTKTVGGKTDTIFSEMPIYNFQGDTSLTLPRVEKRIAREDSISLNILGYSNINSVADDDPSGFKQYYIYVSIPFSPFNPDAVHGIPSTSTGLHNLILLRNFYITPIWSSAASNYAAIDSVKGDFHANKLDLLQYAYIQLPVNLNLVTWVYHHGGDEYMHGYVDLFYNLILTRDTSYASHSSDIIPSGSFGVSMHLRTEDGIAGVGKMLTFEWGMRIFEINTMANSVNPDLKVQYRHLAETSLASNINNKPLLGDDSWFYSFDIEVKYNLIKITNPYLHFDYTQNLPLFGSKSNYINKFFQVQLGVSTTLSDLIDLLTGKGSNSNSGSGSSTAANGSE